MTFFIILRKPMEDVIVKRIVLLLGVILLSGCNSTDLLNAETTDTAMEKVTTSTTFISEETILDTTISEASDEEKSIDEITTNVEEYFALLKAGNWDESQDYLNSNYDYQRKSIFTIDDVAVLKKHYSLFDVTVENVELDGYSAIVKLSVKHPEIQQIIDVRSATIGFGMEPNAPENAMYDLLNGTSLRYETNEAYITVKKKKNNWEIIADSYFALAIDLGKTTELTITILTENEKKQQEMDNYIKSNVKIVDYNIGMCSSYTDENIPGLTKLSIKNNGDKDIESIKVRIDFYDDINNVIFTDDIMVVDSLFNNPIKAGYSWKMDDDMFFEIKNVPEDVNIQRANLYVIEVSLSENKTLANLSPEEEYIKDYVDLMSAKVEMCSSYEKDCPGLRDVSIKNNGDKDIKSLTITVYFQDSNGRDIAENSFVVIGNYFDYTNGLKANYSWAMEDDRFYEIKNLSDEVDISRYRVEISKITFE